MDEVFKSELHYQEHTGELTHKLTQPTEQLILDRNARLRNTPGAQKDLGQGSEGGVWGRQLASIPMVIYERAKREGFELESRDKKHAERELHRFLCTPMGKACLVQGK